MFQFYKRLHFEDFLTIFKNSGITNFRDMMITKYKIFIKNFPSSVSDFPFPSNEFVVSGRVAPSDIYIVFS